MTKRKTVKAKEPVKIRFKSVSGGNKSIYLDIYQGGVRFYKFLKMYLIPETTEAAKMQNANTLIAANAIKSQMIIDLANSEAGIKINPAGARLLLMDWLDLYQADRDKKGRRVGNIVPNLKKILIAYRGDKITLRQVDKRYCLGLIDYMRNGYLTQYGRLLSSSTAHAYCSMFSTVLKAAVSAGHLPINPFDRIATGDRIGVADSKREYLTATELQTLIATPFPDKGIIRKVNGRLYGGRDIRAAFLFSCFTGLRLSDVKALRWGNVVEEGGKWRIDGLIIKKTRRPLYLPLGGEALKHLPERKEAGAEVLVFNLPETDGFTDKKIKEWAAAAGLKKKVTFHVARHTFATLELTAGADLYTVSTLMGHTNVLTTQIYAKIIDRKKVEAVNLVDGLFNPQTKTQKKGRKIQATTGNKER